MNRVFLFMLMLFQYILQVQFVYQRDFYIDEVKLTVDLLTMIPNNRSDLHSTLKFKE